MPRNIFAHLARIPDVLEREEEKKELDTETRNTFDRKTEPYTESKITSNKLSGRTIFSVTRRSRSDVGHC